MIDKKDKDNLSLAKKDWEFLSGNINNENKVKKNRKTKTNKNLKKNRLTKKNSINIFKHR